MRRLMIPVGILLLVGLVSAQYTCEFQSPNLGNSPYGGSYGYDVDDDGVANLWTRSSSGQIVVYNTSLAAWWTVTFPGYTYSYLAIPRDEDGDGLVVPVNMDGDGAGEVVFSGAEYTTDGYSGKIRVYDASSRQLEWESPVISGFTGFANVDDVDGDGKHEIIITRSDYLSYGYVEVYGYTGAGLEGESGYVLESSRVAAEPSICRDGTVIRFQLRVPEGIRLSVFDLAGRRVRKLLEADLPVGEYRVNWDGADDVGDEAPPGVYLYRLDRGVAAETGRLVLTR